MDWPDLVCVPRWLTSDTRYWGETCALSTGKSLVYARDCGSTAGSHGGGPHRLPLPIPEKTTQASFWGGAQGWGRQLEQPKALLLPAQHSEA